MDSLQRDRRTRCGNSSGSVGWGGDQFIRVGLEDGQVGHALLDLDVDALTRVDASDASGGRHRGEPARLTNACNLSSSNRSVSVALLQVYWGGQEEARCCGAMQVMVHIFQRVR